MYPPTKTERRTARRIVAQHATDATELRYFLDMIALWPTQDNDTPPITSTPKLDPAVRRWRGNIR